MLCGLEGLGVQGKGARHHSRRGAPGFWRVPPAARDARAASRGALLGTVFAASIQLKPLTSVRSRRRGGPDLRAPHFLIGACTSEQPPRRRARVWRCLGLC